MDIQINKIFSWILLSAQDIRFHRPGDISDLESSISNLWEAVEHTNDGHPDKPASFFDLSLSQQDRFEHLDR
jgi:hypothetical protein